MKENGSRPLIRKHIKLEEVLQLATPDELGAIVDILLSASSGRLLKDGEAIQKLTCHRETGELYKIIPDIALGVRALGSNGIASLLRRGQPVSYDEIVRDVARELKVDFIKEDKTANIEQKLLEELEIRLAEQSEQPEQDEVGGNHPEPDEVVAKPELVKTGSMFGIISKVGAGAAGSMFVKGAAGVAAVGASAVAVLPAAGLAAYGAYSLAKRVKARPELQSLTMIVVHVARIRSEIIKEDYSEFLTRLRACVYE